VHDRYTTGRRCPAVRLSDASGGVPVENVTGAERLGTG
jgi:hypothetical protein